MRFLPTLERGLTVAALALAAPLAAGLTVAPFGQEDPAAQEDLPTIQDGQNLLGQNQFAEAAEVFGKIAEAQPQNGQAVFLHAYALHASGDLDAAHDRHLEAAAFPQFRPIALYNHACVHALRDEHDIAVTSLREAMDAGFDNLQQLLSDSDMDNIRSDGRFQEILLEMQPEGTYQGTPLTDLAALPPERRFDFYLGEWNMMNGDEVESVVTVARAFDGRGVETTVRDVETGRTMSESLFVYSEEGAWRQVFVQANGTMIVLEGGLEGDALVLGVTGDGEFANGRSVFSEVAADSFAYEWQQTADDGETWTTAARRTFSRR